MNLLLFLSNTPKTQTSGNRDVVYVVNNSASPSAGDSSFASVLTNNNYNVTFFSFGSVSENDLVKRELIIFGTDIPTNGLNGLFKAYNAPILSLVPFETNDHALSSNAANSSASYSSITITNTAHPITQSLAAGTLSVLSSSKKLQFCYTIGSNATTLATINGVPSAKALVAYDTGNLLVDGSVAVNRRVMCWLNNDNISFVNAQGQALMLSVCEWLLGFK